MDRFYKRDDFCEGVCDNSGVYYKFDESDFSKISQHHWWSQPSGVFALVNGNTVSLAKYVLGITERGTKVLRRNGDTFDFRKKNLFYGNIFHKCNAWYLVECFDGRCFKISEGSFDVVSKHIWHIDKNRYVITKLENGKVIKLHRLLLHLSADDDAEVDHINRDTLDNTIENLRIATRSLNCYNRDISKYNKSGCVGVYRMSGYENKWCAQINKEGRRYYLGSFDSYDDAVNARKDAEKIFY